MQRRRSRSRSRGPESIDHRTVEAFKPMDSINSQARVAAHRAKQPINSPWLQQQQRQSLPGNSNGGSTPSPSTTTSSASTVPNGRAQPVTDPRLNRSQPQQSNSRNLQSNSAPAPARFANFGHRIGQQQHSDQRQQQQPRSEINLINTNNRIPPMTTPTGASILRPGSKWASAPPRQDQAPIPLNQCRPPSPMTNFGNTSIGNNTHNSSASSINGIMANGQPKPSYPPQAHQQSITTPSRGLQFEPEDDDDQADAPPPNLHSYKSVSENRNLGSTRGRSNSKSKQITKPTMINHQPTKNNRTLITNQLKRNLITSDSEEDDNQSEEDDSLHPPAPTKRARTGSVVSNVMSSGSQAPLAANHLQQQPSTSNGTLENFIPSNKSAKEWIDEQIASADRLRHYFTRVVPRKVEKVKWLQEVWKDAGGEVDDELQKQLEE